MRRAVLTFALFLLAFGATAYAGAAVYYAVTDPGVMCLRQDAGSGAAAACTSAVPALR